MPKNGSFSKNKTFKAFFQPQFFSKLSRINLMVVSGANGYT